MKQYTRESLLSLRYSAPNLHIQKIAIDFVIECMDPIDESDWCSILRQSHERQIQRVYATQMYQRYRAMVPMDQRNINMPQTPNPNQYNNTWDMQVVKWKHALYAWDTK